MNIFQWKFTSLNQILYLFELVMHFRKQTNNYLELFTYAV